MKMMEAHGLEYKSDDFQLMLMLVNYTAIHEAKAFYTYSYVK